MSKPISLSQKLDRAVSRFFMSRSEGVIRALSGKAVVRDGLTLHPEMQLILWAGKQRPHMFKLRAETVEKARRRMRRATALYDHPLIEVGKVQDVSIEGGAGPLPARHYAPPDASDGAPLLVFFHGGGFVLGDLDTHDAPCRLLCREARVHVLSIDYRLAPEHPFPAAVDDAIAAFRWAQRHAAELGADPNALLVGGDSAGGNLSAIVAQHYARSGPPLAQLLLYPAIDRSTEHPSFKSLCDGFYLELDDMQWFDGMYMSGSDHVPRTDPRISPLHGSELAAVCPAVVVTADFDPLRDEGEAYAARLEREGVRVVLRREAGLIHGFINMIGVGKVSRSTLTEIALALRALADEEQQSRPRARATA